MGFEIKPNLGDGSHVKAIDPRTGRSILIPHSRNLSHVRDGIVKKAIELGYSKKEIIKNLWYTLLFWQMSLNELEGFD